MPLISDTTIATWYWDETESIELGVLIRCCTRGTTIMVRSISDGHFLMEHADRFCVGPILKLPVQGIHPRVANIPTDKAVLHCYAKESDFRRISEEVYNAVQNTSPLSQDST